MDEGMLRFLLRYKQKARRCEWTILNEWPKRVKRENEKSRAAGEVSCRSLRYLALPKGIGLDPMIRRHRILAELSEI